MLVVEKGGTSRMYLPTFDLQMTIPSVETLIDSPETKKRFTHHVVLNHKGLNWKIYRYYLNGENYKSFLYAFAYICKDFSTTFSTAWQINSNARRLEKAISKNNISLSEVERDLLALCKNFTIWSDRSSARKEYMLTVMENLKHQYLG